MRRERKPQTQNRMVFRNRDHREIIMEDQYHGAVYIDNEPEPAWRKYKPRLLPMYIGSYTVTYDSSTRAYGCGPISFDVENTYVSFTKGSLLTTESANDKLYKLGNMLCRCGNGNPIVSMNGYDWKSSTERIEPLADKRTDKYQYGRYLIAYYSNSYNFYEINYNEGSAGFTTTIVKQMSSFPWKVYLGEIDTEEYQGCFALYGTRVSGGARLLDFTDSYKNVTVKLITGLDMSSQDIFTYTGSDLETCKVSRICDVNKRYAFVITYIRKVPTPRAERDDSCKKYIRTSILYSDQEDPTVWHESQIISERLYMDREDNMSNRIYDHIQSGSFESAPIILYQDSTYYFYIYKHTATYTPYTKYYWRNNLKYITGYDQDGVDYEKLVVFTSTDLIHWQEYELPQYVDVPFYWDFDLAENNGRHGGYLRQNTDYTGVRFYLDGNAQRYASALSSGMLPCDESNIIRPDYYTPQFFKGVNDFEIIDGKIQKRSNLENEDLWMCRPVYKYNSTHSDYIYYRWIAVCFTDFLFRVGDSEVYLLDQANPYNQSFSNVDPISEEDYVFDT